MAMRSGLIARRAGDARRTRRAGARAETRLDTLTSVFSPKHFEIECGPNEINKTTHVDTHDRTSH